jgi:hypothetical protein
MTTKFRGILKIFMMALLCEFGTYLHAIKESVSVGMSVRLYSREVTS